MSILTNLYNLIWRQPPAEEPAAQPAPHIAPPPAADAPPAYIDLEREQSRDYSQLFNECVQNGDILVDNDIVLIITDSEIINIGSIRERDIQKLAIITLNVNRHRPQHPRTPVAPLSVDRSAIPAASAPPATIERRDVAARSSSSTVRETTHNFNSSFDYNLAFAMYLSEERIQIIESNERNAYIKIEMEGSDEPLIFPFTKGNEMDIRKQVVDLLMDFDRQTQEVTTDERPAATTTDLNDAAEIESLNSPRPYAPYAHDQALLTNAFHLIFRNFNITLDGADQQRVDTEINELNIRILRYLEATGNNLEDIEDFIATEISNLPILNNLFSLLVSHGQNPISDLITIFYALEKEENVQGKRTAEQMPMSTFAPAAAAATTAPAEAYAPSETPSSTSETSTSEEEIELPPAVDIITGADLTDEFITGNLAIINDLIGNIIGRDEELTIGRLIAEISRNESLNRRLNGDSLLINRTARLIYNHFTTN
jgi:hypothetical protein